MTIEIVVNTDVKSVSLSNLKVGHTYYDKCRNLVLVTDEDYVACLDSGFLIPYDEYDQEDHFIPVKCKLEVYG